MHLFSLGVALLAAVAIIGVGIMYLVNPIGATRSFGLPLPGDGANIAWWLRLKGSRDVVSGFVVLAVMLWGGSHMLGIVLLIEALIPVGDMSIVLAAKGSVTRALSIHGLTAAVMVLGAIPLVLSVA